MKKLIVFPIPMILCLAIAFSSINVFASSPTTFRYDPNQDKDTYSQSTTRNDASYSALFESTIHYNGTKWEATRMYGTTTLFNQSREYYSSNDAMTLTFHYTSMGQTAGGYLTQIDDQMYHNY